MKEEEIDNLIEELKGSWDTEEPTPGHRQRFEQRLVTLEGGSTNPGNEAGVRGIRPLWIQIAAAASVAIMAGLWIFFPGKGDLQERVNEISPEASKSAYYFTNVIELQVRELEASQTPETAPLVRSALSQIADLEADYSRLEQELVSGGNTQLVLKAMITNFQTRIDLLTDVLEQVNEFKLLNTQNNEEVNL